MSLCQHEERDAGRSYPRTCPTCGLTGRCAKGLYRESLIQRVKAAEAQLPYAMTQAERDVLLEPERAAIIHSVARHHGLSVERLREFIGTVGC